MTVNEKAARGVAEQIVFMAVRDDDEAYVREKWKPEIDAGAALIVAALSPRPEQVESQSGEPVAWRKLADQAMRALTLAVEGRTAGDTAEMNVGDLSVVLGLLATQPAPAATAEMVEAFDHEWVSLASACGATVRETPFGTITEFRYLDQLKRFAALSPKETDRDRG